MQPAYNPYACEVEAGRDFQAVLSHTAKSEIKSSVLTIPCPFLLLKNKSLGLGRRLHASARTELGSPEPT